MPGNVLAPCWSATIVNDCHGSNWTITSDSGVSSTLFPLVPDLDADVELEGSRGSAANAVIELDNRSFSGQPLRNKGVHHAQEVVCQKEAKLRGGATERVVSLDDALPVQVLLN